MIDGGDVSFLDQMDETSFSSFDENAFNYNIDKNFFYDGFDFVSDDFGDLMMNGDVFCGGGGVDEDLIEFNEKDIVFDLEDDLSDGENDRIGNKEEIENDRNSENTCPCSSLPFWFSNEDDDHMKMIWNTYMEYLNVENRCRCFRMFIGKIKRQQVINQGNMFMTLDKAEIYKKNPSLPLGGKMPLSDTIILLTTWSNEGLPINFMDLSKNEEILHFWTNRIIKPKYSSIIYCNPVWETDCDYEYSVSPNEKDIGYAKEPFSYSRYLTQKENFSEEEYDNEYF